MLSDDCTQANTDRNLLKLRLQNYLFTHNLSCSTLNTYMIYKIEMGQEVPGTPAHPQQMALDGTGSVHPK